MKAKIWTNFAGIATITTKGTSMKTMVALVLAFAALAALILNSIPAPAFAAILKDPRDYATNRNFDIKGAGIDDNGDPYIYRCIVMQEEQLQIQQASSWRMSL